LPHEILDLEPFELALAVWCGQQADAATADLSKHAFPVIALNL